MPAVAPHRSTRQRAAVLAALSGLPGFHTAQQVHELVVARGEHVALATVYRNLSALAEAGEIDVVRTPDGQCGYRRCDHGEHHHHLICRSCGRAVEIELGSFEGLVAAVAHRHGYTQVAHEIELFGLCPACSAG